MKLGMISLGCAKNLIDTELFLGVAKKYNLEITNNIYESDIIVINTCGFIESAKKEAIDTILDATSIGKNKVVIAMGCLVERYLEDLKESIPEVDFYFPIKDYDNIDKLFNKILNKNDTYKMDYESRVLTTLPHSAYLRISEGCDNRCSYCAIPLIRGNFKSRTFDSLINEAKSLVKQGVKEITLIGQDTTRYGTDLKEGKYLEDLLHEISLIDGVETVRVLYLYPDEITDNVIMEIKNNPKVAKYFDIPIQHASNKMLKAMNRRGDKEFLVSLINKIKTNIPDAIIRTTLIVGFPGESDEDFAELIEFIKEVKFDKLGVFKYSPEEGTLGATMKDQIDEEVKNSRYLEVVKTQEEIAKERCASLKGSTHKTLVTGFDQQKKLYKGRSYAFAPDDVDGIIYIKSNNNLLEGDIINVKITSNMTHDLIGEEI